MKKKKPNKIISKAFLLELLKRDKQGGYKPKKKK